MIFVDSKAYIEEGKNSLFSDTLSNFTMSKKWEVYISMSVLKQWK